MIIYIPLFLKCLKTPKIYIRYERSKRTYIFILFTLKIYAVKHIFKDVYNFCINIHKFCINIHFFLKSNVYKVLILNTLRYTMPQFGILHIYAIRRNFNIY